MPQNWWDKYPKIVPSPAALPLPGPGGIMPGAGMDIPPLPPQVFGTIPPSPGAFDPSSFAGGGFAGDKLLDRAPLKAPFAANEGGHPVGPTAAVQWAIDAIRNGADPKAVRARLQQIANSVSLFPDSIPAGARGAMRGFSRPQQSGPMAGLGSGDLDANSYPAGHLQDRFGDLGSWSEAGMATPKGTAQKYVRATGINPLAERADAVGRAVVNDVSRLAPPNVNDPAVPNLTPQQIHRRNENSALLGDPRILAFLDMISYSEGNTNYDSLFGNHHGTFTDRSTHPGNQGELYHGVRQGAAGRYQIEPRTYDGLNRLLGRFTMSDRDQDLMAVELIREGRALEALRAGRLDEAISRLGQRRTWASFPVLVNGRWENNPSHQLTRNFEELRARYQEALNRYSRHGPGLAGTANGLGR